MFFEGSSLSALSQEPTQRPIQSTELQSSRGGWTRSQLPDLPGSQSLFAKPAKTRKNETCDVLNLTLGQQVDALLAKIEGGFKQHLSLGHEWLMGLLAQREAWEAGHSGDWRMHVIRESFEYLVGRGEGLGGESKAKVKKRFCRTCPGNMEESELGEVKHLGRGGVQSGKKEGKGRGESLVQEKDFRQMK